MNAPMHALETLVAGTLFQNPILWPLALRITVKPSMASYDSMRLVASSPRL